CVFLVFYCCVWALLVEKIKWSDMHSGRTANEYISLETKGWMLCRNQSCHFWLCSFSMLFFKYVSLVKAPQSLNSTATRRQQHPTHKPQHTHTNTRTRAYTLALLISTHFTGKASTPCLLLSGDNNLP